ncbi:MAG: cytochrome c oxidase assembly protein [Burkholderiaceae bacterium]|jgi:cytochrome c oxidase assembly protein subunit 11|nr:cytochrome c oxidase assembly protein [Burkholderiaceae bacterium]
MSEARDASAENRTILRKLLVVAVLMFGFGWALIPLYRKICEVTGINLLTNKDPAVEARARNTQVDTSRTIVVEFDANRQGPWRFKPQVNHMTVHPGELVHVDYDLVNLEGRPMAGQAIPSYAPMQSAQYFQKLECFCFKQQVLAAGETRRFPVVFFIDPNLPKDVTQITLSYTFFEVAGALPRQAPSGGGDARS